MKGIYLVKNKKGQQKDYRLYFHEIQGDGSLVTSSY